MYVRNSNIISRGEANPKAINSDISSVLTKKNLTANSAAASPAAASSLSL